jgi:sugar lactone lactonase YvrE
MRSEPGTRALPPSLIAIACLGACLAACGGVAPADRTSVDLLQPTTGAPDLGPAVDLYEPPVVHALRGVMVSTLAGSDTAGAQNGTGAAAQFSNPVGVALDANGLLYVTEYDGSRVRTVTAGGATGTLTSQAGFVEPYAVAVLSPTHLLVQTDCDATGTKGPSTGTLWTVPMASPVAMSLVGSLGRPRGLAVLSPTTVAVSDHTREAVSLLNPTTGELAPLAGSGSAGFVNGRGDAASFDAPIGVAAMPDGSLVVADSGNHCLRRVQLDGTVTTFAGDGNAGMIDGPKESARFDRPIAVAVDGAGFVYVSDQGDNHRIRRVGLDGQVQTVAGSGVAGFMDGAGEQAQFYAQEGIAVLPSGKVLYVADGNDGDGTAYHRVRQIEIP